MEFSKKYWDLNYSDRDSMDGIGNALEHARYLKSLFDLELIHIKSIVDLGFGTGDLFRSLIKEFVPYKAQGIEPSKYIFDESKFDDLREKLGVKLAIKNIDILSWAMSSNKAYQKFDLAVCTSVFQYIETKDLKVIIPVLAKRVKYLYLTVPTDKELDLQISDLNFFDKYALRRSRKLYLRLLKPHFKFVSSRLLESRVHFNEESTHFQDLLYRF